MAMEPIYRRQVAPAQGAAPAMADAASFGGQLVQQAGQAVESLHREGLEDLAIERRHSQAEQWSGFQRAYAETREEFAGISREARKTAGAGHGEQMRAAWERLRGPLLDSITDDDVRRQASAALDEYGTRVMIAEGDFEGVRRVENALSDWSQAQTVSANRMRRLETPEDYTAELQIGYQAIAGMDDLTDPQRAELARNWGQTGTIAYLRGVIDRDPELARAMLTDGAGLFDDVLQPEQVQVLLNGADVEVRALEVQARQQAALALEDMRERAQTALDQHEGGVVIADETWAGLIAEATSSGDTSLASRLTRAAADSVFNRQYEGAPPLVLQQDIARLAGKEGRSETEDRQLAWLQRTIGTRSAQFERDPAGFMAGQGGMPPLDPADPASFAARTQWARAQSRATGRYVPPLTQAEAAPFRDILQRSGEGELLAQLDQFPDVLARVDAAQLIDPDNARLHRLAAFDPAMRGLALRGAQALAENRDLLKVDPMGEAHGVLQAAQANLQGALGAISPEDRAAVWEATRMLLAGQMDQAPGLDPESFLTAARVSRAMQRALGARQATDANGNTVWRGGLQLYGGRHAFIVSGGLTVAEWNGRIRADVAAQRAAGTGPVNPDGSALVLDANLRPRWMGGEQYMWLDSQGQPARRADGGLFVSNAGVR